MGIVAGTLIVFASVLGGFVAHGGQLLAIWQPYEIVIICGAALGAFVIANPGSTVTKVGRAIPAIFKAGPYGKDRYLELLRFMHALFAKARKEGLIGIESDIDDPENSELFRAYPGLLEDAHSLTFVQDYMRLIIGGEMDAFQLENLMDVELETHHHDVAEPGHALNRVADALPGFGIVAAVLGIVNTMQALGGPVEEIGQLVAAALVGSFLGILLAYGMVGPLATALSQRGEEEAQYFTTIKTCLMASLRGYAPKVAVEFGRKSIPTKLRPGFDDLEAELKAERG
ncbi:MAG: flagellar motor stator protein MotA [Gammaproteobacteria bacterium]|nr:MAG: flagellar motor stator protein MotA [Gammaproteobacteria bacterium]